MSDLVIRSGRLIEVDTVSLRGVAGDLRGIGLEVEELAGLVDVALDPIAGASPMASTASMQASLTSQLLRHAADDASGIASSLETSADMYEIVELAVERGVADAAGDAAAVARIDARIADLDDDMVAQIGAGKLLLFGPKGESDELRDQIVSGALPLGLSTALAFGALAQLARMLVRQVGHGTVPGAARLRGPAPEVTIARVDAKTTGAPTSLADVAARVPGGGASRVRVERYTTPDGPQFAVYIAGTQNGGGDAFDMRSNLELYTGERSASYEVVLAALADAGAEPGDVVHLAGHSQGAMIGERLALEGPYEAQTVVSFGNPVQAELGPDTLTVSLRHTDDPVPALQGGGSPVGVGAAGSFIVERVADPAVGLRDAGVPSHQMTEYVETAALVDASADPRVGVLAERFQSWGEPEEVIEYVAERVSRPSAGEG